MVTYHNYDSFHPWFYKLGGKRLSLKEIREAVRKSGYRGYMCEDIDAADKLAEPKRSAALRKLRDKARRDLSADIAIYREVSLQLARHRQTFGQIDPNGCADVFVSMSLKHNHIYNDFAHLAALDSLLKRQLSLFDF
jgi:hypothetical protein